MMKPINFITKTAASIFFILVGTSTLLCQLQTATISGIISDTEYNPIKDATVSVWFNKSLISEVQCDSHGYYKIDVSNYGGIQDVSIQFDAKHYYWNNESENIHLLNFPPIKNIIMYEGQLVRLRCRESVTLSNIVSNSFASTTGTMFRLPTGTFAYNKPGLYDPVYYYENISSQFTIVDKTGKPIPNAKVEIKIPDDKARWGMTDKNGQLMMHMQFEKGARNGKITISADGFRTKKMLSQIFYPNNRNTIKLHAIK